MEKARRTAGGVEAEFQFAEILDRPDGPLDLHERADLLLAGVGEDRLELGFEHRLGRFQANLRRLGEIAVDGHFIDPRHLGDRLAKLRPDPALGMKEADQQLFVDDTVVGVQIGTGGQEDPRRPHLPQQPREGDLHALRLLGLARIAVGEEGAAAGGQVSVGIAQEVQPLGREAEDRKRLLGFLRADGRDRVALLDVAVAHAAVGHHRGVDLGPFGDSHLEDQTAAKHNIVVVRRHEEPAFRQPPPIVKKFRDAGSRQQPARRAAGISDRGRHAVGLLRLTADKFIADLAGPLGLVEVDSQADAGLHEDFQPARSCKTLQ